MASAIDTTRAANALRFATQPIERPLQICMATATALGVLLLSMEQRSPVIAIAFPMAAAFSVFLTDIRGSVDLPRGISNLVAIVALVVTLAQIREIGDGSDLLALANLLIYLQLVLLFQRKDERKYWQIASLSLLQVVVAAALNLSILFGILLILYFFVALFAMGLLYIYRETISFASMLVVDGGGGQAVSGRPGQKIELGHNFGVIITIGLKTLLATVLIFFVLPRLGGEEDPPTLSNLLGSTGVSAEMSLDGMERILENPEAVLRLSLMDPKTGKRFAYAGEPYIHGTVLVEYHREGHWRYQHEKDVQPLKDPDPARPTVRQDIVLESGQYPFLFAIAPAFQVPGRPVKPELAVERFSHQIMFKDRDRIDLGNDFSYSLITTGISVNQQNPFRPQPAGFVRSSEYGRCRRIDRNDFPELIRIANELLERDPTRSGDPLSICRYLESHFLFNRQFKYSLGRSPQRNVDVDPIEDFISNHKSGHCEYFASALALMLRSQGIPARLVSGYQGGDYNEPGKYYVVRQLHAHAWVEAFLSRDQLSDVDIVLQDSDEGAWVRLDPTPSGDDSLGQTAGFSILNRVHQWMDYSQVVWNRYVLGMDSDRQRESVYQPILDRMRQIALTAVDTRAWESFLVSIGEQLGMKAADVRRAMGWFVAGLVALLMIGLGSIVQLLRFLRQHRQSRTELTSAGAATREAVPSYGRLARLLRSYGWRRTADQTPSEFAKMVAVELERLGLPTSAIRVPTEVVGEYYRVRYGHQETAGAERERLAAAVRQLARCLAGKRGMRPAPGRQAFSLVEVLVSVAIIGLLVSLLIPAVQSAREAARRAACTNNLRQISIGLQNFLAAQGAFPPGAVAMANPNSAGTPWTFYRWSALSALTPYLENSPAQDMLHLDEPLYDANFSVTLSNRDGVRLIVPEFLCPSDVAQRVSPHFGPTNYAMCTGTGMGSGSPNNDGSPIDTDGVFAVNSRIKPAMITDGLGATAVVSESILGQPQETIHDPRREYKFVTTSPLTAKRCDDSQSWNVNDPRGFAWVSGEYRCALYNHFLPPNAATADCMGVVLGAGLDRLFTPFGWRAARSWHVGGVNVAFADSSVRGVAEGVDPAVWRGFSTVSGGDTVGGDEIAP